MKKIKEIYAEADSVMPRAEFAKHATRIMKLFQFHQPSNEEFLELRIKDDAPGDDVVEYQRTIEEIMEQTMMAMTLFHTPAEGSA